jgi:hypothetical protein
MLKYLFIGGSSDGRRIAVPNTEISIHISVPDPYCAYVPLKLVNEGVRQSHEEYRPIRIRGHEKEFIVFGFNGLNVDDVLERLIEKFKV